jgi:hypothetical protein
MLMNTKTRYTFILLVGVIHAALESTLAQGTLGNGTFQDLNFEEATLIAYPSGQPTTSPGPVYAAQALPGWTVYIGGIAQNQIPFDSGGSDYPVIVLSSKPNVLDGNYGAFLGGSGVNPNQSPSSSLQQTGIIPIGANSIEFLSNPNIHMTFAVGGQMLPLVSTPQPSGATLYAANIPGFGGQTATIAFNQTPTAGGDYLDDITFSSQVVPEPSGYLLFAAGAFSVFWNVRRQNR